jgi:hypothetical protein
MVTNKLKVAYAAYASCTVILFILLGRRLLTLSDSIFRDIADWVVAPGVMIATLLTNVHSEAFVPALVVSNILIYLLIPWIFWAWLRRRKRRNET